MEAPLLPHSSTSSPSISTISIRLATFFLILFVALYANYESPKNFDITILTSASVSTESPLVTRRFHLLFISNGRASRAIFQSSDQIKHILYPNGLYPQKQVNHVYLQLATHNMPEPVMVGPGSEPGSYVISLSPRLVMERDARRAVELAIRRAMARVWIWDGDGEAASEIVDAIMEGLSGDGSGQDPIRSSWAELNTKHLLKGSWNVSTSAVGQGQVI